MGVRIPHGAPFLPVALWPRAFVCLPLSLHLHPLPAATGLQLFLSGYRRDRRSAQQPLFRRGLLPLLTNPSSRSADKSLINMAQALFSSVTLKKVKNHSAKRMGGNKCFRPSFLLFYSYGKYGKIHRPPCSQ